MKLVALILVATLSYSFCSKIQINGYRSAIFMESRLWTGRVMPYKFDGTLSKRDERTIKHHIASFNKEMRGCLKIRPKIISDKLFVTVSGGKSTACRTEIGKNPIWRPMKIVFGKNCASRNGTVKHEFIHRFGRYHEHQRPDRDKYIKIVNSMSRQHNYRKCKDCVTHDVPYDFRSVMHYPGSDIKIKGKHFDPKEMRSSHNLSRLDKLILRKMYKCPIPEEYLAIECPFEDKVIWGCLGPENSPHPDCEEYLTDTLDIWYYKCYKCCFDGCKNSKHDKCSKSPDTVY